MEKKINLAVVLLCALLSWSQLVLPMETQDTDSKEVKALVTSNLPSSDTKKSQAKITVAPLQEMLLEVLESQAQGSLRKEGFISTLSCLPEHLQRAVLLHAIRFDETLYSIIHSCLYTPPIILKGHTQSVWKVSWSPEGTYLASCSNDNTARVWLLNMATERLKEVRIICCDYLSDISWSPTGSNLALCSNDHQVHFWNIKTGPKLISPIRTNGLLTKSINWSPKSNHVALSVDCDIQLWNVETSVLEQVFPMTSFIESLSWSPDGTHLAFCSTDNHNLVSLLNLTTKEVKFLSGHTDNVLQTNWSPCGKYIASCSWDHTIRIWDSKQSATVQILVHPPPTGNSEVSELVGETSKSAFKSVSWSPCGRYIAACSFKNNVYIFDVKSGKPLGKPFIIESPTSVSWSPNGKYLAAGSLTHTISVWNVQFLPAEETLCSLTAQQAHFALQTDRTSGKLKEYFDKLLAANYSTSSSSSSSSGSLS